MLAFVHLLGGALAYPTLQVWCGQGWWCWQRGECEQRGCCGCWCVCGGTSGDPGGVSSRVLSLMVRAQSARCSLWDMGLGCQTALRLCQL